MSHEITNVTCHDVTQDIKILHEITFGQHGRKNISMI